MNTAGCEQRSAGIGNIAYVKDLLTENIVTTKLRCSRFGFAYHPLVKFGWVWIVFVKFDPKFLYLLFVHVTFKSISHTKVTNTFVELPVPQTILSKLICMARYNHAVA